MNFALQDQVKYLEIHRKRTIQRRIAKVASIVAQVLIFLLIAQRCIVFQLSKSCNNSCSILCSAAPLQFSIRADVLS